MHRLPHRETPPSQEKHPLGLDRQIYSAREPLLFLLCRRQLRSFLPEVLFLLSLPCQVVPERTGIRPPPIGSRTDSRSGPGPWPPLLRQPQAPAHNRRFPVGRKNRYAFTKVVPPATSSLSGPRSAGRGPLPDFDPANRTIPDADFGSSGERKDFLRGCDSGKSGCGPAQTGTTDLRSRGDQGPPRPFSNRCNYGWRHSLAAHGLPRDPHPAVPQARSRTPHRDHPPPHPRLLHRQEPAQLARVTQNRLSGPPSPSGNREHHTRLHARRTDLPTAQSSPHRPGTTCLGSALRRSDGPGHLEGTAGFRSVTHWLLQSRLTKQSGCLARPARGTLHPRPDELSIAAAPASRPDRADSQNSSRPPHNLRLPCRHVLHAHLRKDFASRSWPGAAGKLFLPIGPAAPLR